MKLFLVLIFCITESTSWRKMIKDYKYTFIFIGACILIILSVIFYYYKVSERFPDPHAASAFGDMFGGLSALFSGLSFAGVIIAILMQMQELKLTREEMAKSVEAQKGSQDAPTSQLEQMELINTFQMVDDYFKGFDENGERDKFRIVKDVRDQLTKDLFYQTRFDKSVSPFITDCKLTYRLDSRTINILIINSGASCTFFIKPMDPESSNSLKNFRYYTEGTENKWTDSSSFILQCNKTASFNFENVNFESKTLHFELHLKGYFVKKVWVRDMFVDVNKSSATMRLGSQSILLNSDANLNT